MTPEGDSIRFFETWGTIVTNDTHLRRPEFEGLRLLKFSEVILLIIFLRSCIRSYTKFMVQCTWEAYRSATGQGIHLRRAYDGLSWASLIHFTPWWRLSLCCRQAKLSLTKPVRNRRETFVHVDCIGQAHTDTLVCLGISVWSVDIMCSRFLCRWLCDSRWCAMC